MLVLGERVKLVIRKRYELDLTIFKETPYAPNAFPGDFMDEYMGSGLT
jgi:hypothetical protein